MLTFTKNANVTGFQINPFGCWPLSKQVLHAVILTDWDVRFLLYSGMSARLGLTSSEEELYNETPKGGSVILTQPDEQTNTRLHKLNMICCLVHSYEAFARAF